MARRTGVSRMRLPGAANCPGNGCINHNDVGIYFWLLGT